MSFFFAKRGLLYLKDATVHLWKFTQKTLDEQKFAEQFPGIEARLEVSGRRR